MSKPCKVVVRNESSGVTLFLTPSAARTLMVAIECTLDSFEVGGACDSLGEMRDGNDVKISIVIREDL